MACLQASSCSSVIIPAKDLSSASSSFVSSCTALPLASCCPPKPASKLTPKCSLSEHHDHASSSAIVGRRALASVVATGAALAVFTNMAIAAQGPGNEGARRTAEKADKLLKAADKLNIEDAPQRFGPGRPGGAEDPTKISQIAGSGPLSSSQEAVTGAAKNAQKGLTDAAKNVQQKSGGGFFGFGKKQSNAVTDNAKGALSQATGKTDEVVSSVRQTINRDGFGRFRGQAKDVASDVKGAAGQAQNKKGLLGKAAKDAIGQAQSKTNLGNSGGNVLSSLQEGIQGLKEGVAQTGADAKSTIEKSLQ